MCLDNLETMTFLGLEIEALGTASPHERRVPRADVAPMGTGPYGLDDARGRALSHVKVEATVTAGLGEKVARNKPKESCTKGAEHKVKGEGAYRGRGVSHSQSWLEFIEDNVALPRKRAREESQEPREPFALTNNKRIKTEPQADIATDVVDSIEWREVVEPDGFRYIAID